MAPIRSLVVWCRDWPVVALGRSFDEVPTAVTVANRVVATSPSARVAGVAEGQRRREAQRRCPEVAVVGRDLDREARHFERVVAALDDVTARIEIRRPGVCVFPIRGPSRYFGGDQAVANRVRDVVTGVLDDPSGCGVGVADGPFAAGLAARRALARTGTPPLVVEPGGSAPFVARFPVGALDQPDLGIDRSEVVEVLVRLGLRQLGDVAELNAGDMVGRFGADGLVIWQLASGNDEHVAHLVEPPADLDQRLELDPPAERVDQVAFAGKILADRLVDALDGRGLSCTRVLISAETTGGARIERLWRDEGALGAAAIAQRIRWQLDGWLSRPGAAGHGPVLHLALHPDEVVGATGRQHGFWGGVDARDDRARRAAARVQGVLGTDAVMVPEWQGGRSPGEQYRLVPIDTVPQGDGRTLAPGPEPWPGRLPSPMPALVVAEPRPADLVDTAGERVRVTGRGALSGAPARLSIDGGPWVAVERWAGPWVTDERWWDATAHRRRARFQVVVAGGAAHLVTLEAGSWWWEATYD